MSQRGQRGFGTVGAVLATVVVLAMVGAVVFFVESRGHAKELEQLLGEADERVTSAQSAASELGRELAGDIARVLAATIADDLVRADRSMLDAQLAAVVRGDHVVGVVVLGPGGEVIAATDQHFAGRTLDDPAAERALASTAVTVMPDGPATGQVEAVAPLFAGSERAGTVRVFVSLGDFAMAPVAEPPAME